jgi:hypothetical protein
LASACGIAAMKGRVAGKEKSTKAPPFDETRLEDYLSQNIPGFSGPLTVQRFEPIEAMERLIEWLPKQLPPARATSLVHGDLQLDNMIFHQRAPRLVALLDWELSTLGDAPRRVYLRSPSLNKVEERHG